MEGLNGEVGDLLLVPRSHKAVMDRSALNLFGTADLPGTLVLDDLPPGTMVLVHSAVAHARRPKPGSTVRYFTNVGYNSTPTAADPRKWPAYRTLEEMDEINAVALQQGHGRQELDFLFDHRKVFSDEANG